MKICTKGSQDGRHIGSGAVKKSTEIFGASDAPTNRSQKGAALAGFVWGGKRISLRKRVGSESIGNQRNEEETATMANLFGLEGTTCAANHGKKSPA